MGGDQEFARILATGVVEGAVAVARSFQPNAIYPFDTPFLEERQLYRMLYFPFVDPPRLAVRIEEMYSSPHRNGFRHGTRH